MLFALSTVFGQDVKEASKFNKIEINNETKYNINVLIRSFGSEKYFEGDVGKGLKNIPVQDGDFNKIEYIQLTSNDVKFECVETNCNTMSASDKSKTVHYKLSKFNPSLIDLGKEKDEEKVIMVTMKKDYYKGVFSVKIEKPKIKVIIK